MTARPSVPGAVLGQVLAGTLPAGNFLETVTPWHAPSDAKVVFNPERITAAAALPVWRNPLPDENPRMQSRTVRAGHRRDLEE
jgi:hypothetical protein